MLLYKKLFIFLLLLTIVSIIAYQLGKQRNLPVAVKPDRNVAQEKYKLLNKISAEVQVDYLNKLLGNPVYKNILSEDLISYTYVDPDYYLWVLANKDDKVLAYAITSRKKDFNPNLSIFDTKILLNKTLFSDWIDNSNPNLKCYRFIGANNPAYYFEEVYLGNPGLYQTYWVGNNNAAYMSGLPGLKEGYANKLQGQIDCGNITNREVTTFNTFMVWGPFFEIPLNELEKNPTLYFGVDNIQTRTLNE